MRLSQARIATHGSLLLAGACLHWAAAAQASNGIWRCGNSYTDQPCDAGQALDLDDARSAVQKRAADQATREARAEAQRMERDRLRLEATQGPGQAALIDNAPRARETATAPERSMKKGQARKDPQYLSPQDPSAPRKKKRRQPAAVGEAAN
ncbi:hypothetical protein [Variovorax saccharolyticus]|uniref:hypothetical protein n=1 Tax=Variovorax saccharolyticus TaxID=3053516 RepID=UPI0025767877|nr:hypothetical protein [Variovorax sp. J31P216]MDM0025799.1 hypothetical protein [Variovorax sp. J31P216]